jgi:hypothetical protein
VFQHTIDRGIKLIGLDERATLQAIEIGIDLKGKVHCMATCALYGYLEIKYNQLYTPLHLELTGSSMQSD